jgi:hypothetical protein
LKAGLRVSPGAQIPLVQIEAPLPQLRPASTNRKDDESNEGSLTSYWHFREGLL